MNHASFIIAAFAVTAIGVAWLVIGSYGAMRRSESLADDLRADDLRKDG